MVEPTKKGHDWLGYLLDLVYVGAVWLVLRSLPISESAQGIIDKFFLFMLLLYVLGKNTYPRRRPPRPGPGCDSSDKGQK